VFFHYFFFLSFLPGIFSFSCFFLVLLLFSFTLWFILFFYFLFYFYDNYYLIYGSYFIKLLLDEKIVGEIKVLVMEKFRDQSGIVFCQTTQQCVRIAKKLRVCSVHTCVCLQCLHVRVLFSVFCKNWLHIHTCAHILKFWMLQIVVRSVLDSTKFFSCYNSKLQNHTDADISIFFWKWTSGIWALWFIEDSLWDWSSMTIHPPPTLSCTFIAKKFEKVQCCILNFDGKF